MPVDRRECSFRMPSPHRLSDSRLLLLQGTPMGCRSSEEPSAEGYSGVSHKNRRFQTGFGLPLSSQKPSPNAETEQGNGDDCERKRRQPDWHVVHMEAPDKCCNHRHDYHTRKDSKSQIWLLAPPQNREQGKTGYLRQCWRDLKKPSRRRPQHCPGRTG